MTGKIRNPCSQQAFENRYRESRDPWNFATSTYEQDRYHSLVRALTSPIYRRAFEPGCSIGELTARLAPRCEEVVATDLAPSAVALARERCSYLTNVTIYQADLANGPPIGPFDLVVLSEVGYYFSPKHLSEIAAATAAQIEPHGELLAAHWLGSSEDHVLHADDVHRILREQLPMTWIKGERCGGFRIDTWKRL